MKTIAGKSSAEASEASMDCDRPEVGHKGLTVIASRPPFRAAAKAGSPPPPAGGEVGDVAAGVLGA
eukprot:4429960-Heterocapsa_arctica.AAC.1